MPVFLVHLSILMISRRRKGLLSRPKWIPNHRSILYRMDYIGAESNFCSNYAHRASYITSVGSHLELSRGVSFGVH